MKAWSYFAFVQLASIAAFVVGIFLLAPLSYFRLWKPVLSRNYNHYVLGWRGGWLTYIWGNEEDGVTGAAFYRARFKDDRLAAYLWSAWRNNCNNLRFVFRWYGKDGAPFVKWRKGKWSFQAGWFQDNGFPVLSGGYGRK